MNTIFCRTFTACIALLFATLLCNGGVCYALSLCQGVTCTASDQCHVAGTCDTNDLRVYVVCSVSGTAA